MTLTVTESETIAVKVTADVGCAGGGHRTITYAVEGVPNTLLTDAATLNSAITESQAEREFILAWLRYRRARGKPEVGVRIV